jgi:predicted amidohydrolase
MSTPREQDERIVTIATLCLLNGKQYETVEYVLDALAGCPAGADLIVLPHMPFLSFDAAMAAAELKSFADFAAERRAYLALSMTERDGEDTYFTAVLLEPSGEIVGHYRKAHALPDDEVSLGEDLPVFPTEFGPIGMTIGTDFYFAEVYETLRMQGADIITWHHYPERLRDHSMWEPMLMARCIDGHVHIVTAMYADEATYITHQHSIGMPGAAWGRSMVLNRVGTAVADTGYEDGIATATVNLDKRKKNVWGDDFRTENVFIVSSYGDRQALHPVAEPYVKPELPEYRKRTCRLAIGSLGREDMWRDGKVPETMLGLIDAAAGIEPDLLLLSEQGCKVTDETTARVMETIAEKAAEYGFYIALSGIRVGDSASVLHVWNRHGEVVYREPIYWEGVVPELDVFDADFGRVGGRNCGDLYTPFLDRVLALKGAEIILDPSRMWGASGYHNEMMLRARAADNAVWIACAHWNHSDPSLRSVIINPYGQVVAASDFQRDGIVHHDIDLDDERVYYAGLSSEPGERGETGLAAYALGNLPEQRKGWREMLFAARRPELYGIIPTVNEVIMRYRPEKCPYWKTQDSEEG